jgi:DNA mismatch endonuclease (patch repair protein)
MLHAIGYRYSVHRSDLPGRPDVVFPSRRKAVFVHGCFWHRHLGCKAAKVPLFRATLSEAHQGNVG